MSLLTINENEIKIAAKLSPLFAYFFLLLFYYYYFFIVGYMYVWN